MSNDKKDPRERLEAEVLSLLREKFYLRENGDGTFSQEICADYRDEMEDKTAAEICESDDPREAFEEKMSEWYDDYASDLRTELLNELEGDMQVSYPDGFSKKERETLREILQETVYYNYPEEHYLKQKFYVTIMTDTGDANYDFVLNSEYLCCQGKRGERIDRRAGIAWLARSQGYSKTQLQEALKLGDMAKPKGFLESMRVELANLPSRMSTVTFLVQMTLEQLISVNAALRKYERKMRRRHMAKKRSDCGYVVLGKETMTGLFNPWSGAGSVLEVELEKDVRLPLKFIYSALPDGAGRWKYGSVGDVYGMCGSAWRDSLKEINIPKKAAA